MQHYRPRFSICIPAYNRAKFLEPLLLSIKNQDYRDYEIVICEDNSPERKQISAEISRITTEFGVDVNYIENERNLGYDGNIRNLISRARGQYCFFMGNDDIMAEGALCEVNRLIEKHPDVGFVLKSYAWFDKIADVINQEVRYFNEECYFPPSLNATALCFRRSGVISGFIVHRDSAYAVATEQFDGTLYYQMHIASQVVSTRGACFTPKILVLCRNSEVPDFGASDSERGVYTPGVYTVAARLAMLGGISKILDSAEASGLKGLKPFVMRDYANYFYPYIRDQLHIPIGDYLTLYKGYIKLGYWRFPMFHLYFLVCRILGAHYFDFLTRFLRNRIGRTVQIGNIFR